MLIMFGMEAGAEVSNRIQEVAERANVPEDFVRQLIAGGALPADEGELEVAGAVRRVRLLRSWTAAGLSVETILTLVNRGALSLAFLDAPVMDLPERLDYSYEQLAADHGAPMSFLHSSLETDQARNRKGDRRCRRIDAGPPGREAEQSPADRKIRAP
jgi:hypothetical protein